MGLFSGVTGTVPSNPLTHLILDEKDFTCLVRGGVLHVGNLRIFLKDIGFDQMLNAIDKAKLGHDTYKDHAKER